MAGKASGKATAFLRRRGLIVCALLAGSLFAAVASAKDTAPQVQTFQRGEFHFVVGPAPAWVDVQSVPPKWDEKSVASVDAGWRNWLADSQVARFGGQRVRYTDFVSEALSAELLTEAGKLQIQFNPAFETLTVHEISLRREGTWHDRLKPDAVTLARREEAFERDMALGTVSAMIVLDDLRHGDLVRMRYSIAGRNPIMAGLDGEAASFAWGVPVLKRQLRVLFDTDAQVQEFRDTRLPAARVRRQDAWQEWRYVAEGMAPILSEDREPAWFWRYPYVYISEQRGWGEVTAWARTLYPPPAPLPADLRERIEQWRKLPDADARIAAALLAVQEDVRYFGQEIGENTHRPAEPALVWEQRRGDCKDKSRLLVAILAALDVEAYPALVSASDGKSIAGLPPAASVFDHVIVQVRRDGASLWLDPTRTGQRGAAAAQEISDFGYALPIAPGVSALVPVARNPASVNRTRIVERYTPQAEGEALDLQVRAEYAGTAANEIRRNLRSGGAEALGRSFAEFYRRRHAELDVLQPLKVQDDAAANRVVLIENYRLGKPWTGSTPAARALDVSADSIASLLALPQTLQRKSPLAMDYPSDTSHRIELQLPAGWRWNGTAAQRELDDAAASYRYQAGQDGGSVFSEESVVVRAASVEPARISEHLGWRRAAREQNLQRWQLALPPDKADKSRKERMKNLLRDVMNDNAKTAGKPDEN